MRTVEEIRADLPRVAFATDMYVAARKSEQQYEIELRAAITTDIPIDRLKAICAAEKDGKLYTSHDVAVILANAIGDDCACNINSNDEWLPQLCELQEACPYPVGVACWEQYLKHRAGAETALKESNSTTLKSEAEKALGKEQA